MQALIEQAWKQKELGDGEDEKKKQKQKLHEKPNNLQKIEEEKDSPLRKNLRESKPTKKFSIEDTDSPLKRYMQLDVPENKQLEEFLKLERQAVDTSQMIDDSSSYMCS